MEPSTLSIVRLGLARQLRGMSFKPLDPGTIKPFKKPAERQRRCPPRPDHLPLKNSQNTILSQRTTPIIERTHVSPNGAIVTVGLSAEEWAQRDRAAADAQR